MGLSAHILGILLGWLLRGAVKEEILHKKRKHTNVIVSVGITLLSLASLTGIGISLFEYREATNCQSQYNKNFSKALAERQQAADNDRAATKSLAQATVDMLDVILNPNSSVDQRTESIRKYRQINQEYVRITEEAEKTRQDNPLPLIPECAIKEK